MRAPPGLMIRRMGGTAGTQAGSMLPRYHPVSCVSRRRPGPSLDPGLRRGTECHVLPWRAGLLGQLNLYVHTRGEIELHQSVDRLRGGLHDVEQPLVRAHLELLARLLVDVGRAVDGELLDARRQRDGTADESTRAPSGVGDVARGLIEDTMIERLQANPDILRFHNLLTDCKEPAPLKGAVQTKHDQSGALRPGTAKTLLYRRAARISPTRAAAGPILLRDLGDNPCADGPAAFADREAQALV